MDGIPNINFYYVFTFFFLFLVFIIVGLVGGGCCHCRRFSPVDTAVIFVPRQYVICTVPLLGGPDFWMSLMEFPEFYGTGTRVLY